MQPIYSAAATRRNKYRNVEQLTPKLRDSLLLEDLWLLQYFQILTMEAVNELAMAAKVPQQHLHQLLQRHELEVRARQTPKIIDAEVVNGNQPVQPKNAGSQVP